jgi:hypothetical protein
MSFVEDSVESILAEWEERGRALRKTLLAERVALMKKVEVIDATLRMMPGGTPPGNGRRRIGRAVRPCDGSLQRLVVEYLKKNPGAFGDEIRAATGTSRAYLVFLRKQGILAGTGSKHRFRWFVSGAERDSGAIPDQEQ